MKEFTLVFMGTSPFAFPSLEKLLEEGHPLRDVVTRPDQPAGRGKKLSPPPIKEKAKEYHLNVWQPSGQKELLEVLITLRPLVLINVAFGMILPREAIKLPPRGSINLHPSLLPAYRGAAPIQRAIMAGEDVTGVSALYMSPRLDAGDIILQKQIPIKESDTYGTLCQRLALEGAETLSRALELVLEGEDSPQPQREDLATYAPPLKKDEERLNWHRKAVELHNQIRALNPRPGAHAYLGRRRVKLWESAPLEGEKGEDLLAPGTVCRVERDFFDIVTGKGKLRICRLQAEGKKSLEAGDFLAGNPLREGDRFE